MAKKPAITGVARPQGFIDDTLKAIAKSLGRPPKTKRIKLKEINFDPTPFRAKAARKRNEITVDVGDRSSSVRKVTAQPKRGAGVAGPTLPKGRPTIKIDSRLKARNETYSKGTKEYKDAVKANKRKEKSLKDINKYSNARATRNMEYNEALRAEKDIKKVTRDYGKSFADIGPQKKVVDSFKNMSPRKVKSGKRPAVKSPKPNKSITRGRG
jgi:hypothetical protein